MEDMGFVRMVLQKAIAYSEVLGELDVPPFMLALCYTLTPFYSISLSILPSFVRGGCAAPAALELGAGEDGTVPDHGGCGCDGVRAVGVVHV